jgi:hypothetical protein
MSIVVNLQRGSGQDTIEKIVDGSLEERQGLYKELPQGFEQRPLYEVLQYMCSPDADETNEAYNPAETSVAANIRSQLSDVTQFRLYGVMNGELDMDHALDVSLSIDDHAPDIYSSQQLNLHGEQTAYKLVELQFSPTITGG